MTAPVDPDLAGRAGPLTVALVAAGGALGTLARFGVGRLLLPEPGTWPWSTFVVNVVGCLLIGFVIRLAVDRWPTSAYLRPFIAVGFIGGFTTFSTVMVDTDLLVRDGAGGLAAAYLVVSVAAGLCGVAAGIALARRAGRAMPPSGPC